MRRLFLCLLLMGLSFMTEATAQTIYFVKPAPAGMADGSDWNNASGDLQAMINKATANDQVWVAGGTYLPNRNINNPDQITLNDRHNAFLLKKDVQIYGGFAGTETKLADRDLHIKANTSFLSGDIGIANDPKDNAYHVVVSDEEVGTAELNGFTISYGYNDVDGGAGKVNGHSIFNVHGGGVYNRASAPKYTNLIISGNQAFNLGGGMYNIAGAAPILTNVVLSGNNAKKGGGIFIEAAIGPMVLTNVTIAGNTNYGLFITNSAVNIRNSVIAKNGLSGFQIRGPTSTVNCTYSFIEGRSADDQGNLSGNLTPGFVSSITPELSTAGDFHLSEFSPLINAGNDKYYDPTELPDLSAVTTDLDGSPRSQQRQVDIGAYESAFATTLQPSAEGVIYISPAGAGNRDGSSWGNAAAAESLQNAINSEDVQQVWVAGGTYKPGSRADGLKGTISDRNNAFVLKKGVHVYGGFAGTEALLTDRDLNSPSNASILSGDVGVIGNAEDNCYHVVIALGKDGGDADTTVLDGFTIQDGYANGTENLQIVDKTIYPFYGGGLYTDGGAPVLRNLKIQHNYADKDGGGYYMQSGTSNCSQLIVSGNSSSQTAGLCMIASTATFTNTLIAGNFSTAGVGGIKSDQSNTVFTNCTIVANQGPQGGLLNQQSVMNFRNSVVYDNPGGIDNSDQGSVVAYYSLVQDMDATDNGNIPAIDPQFIDPRSAAQAPFIDGDFHLQQRSPAVNQGHNDFFSKDSVPDLHLLDMDLSQVTRMQGGRIDLGAYESFYGPMITPSAQGVVYVSVDGNGDNTGDSWANATSDLQKAINANGAHQVWVSGGIYIPRYMVAGDASSSRDKAFVLKKDVQVIGGFAGTETSLAERQLSNPNNTSILSGNLGDLQSTADNAFHVVISASEFESGMLDGFTIQDGRADSTGYCTLDGQRLFRYTGGGLLISGSSPVIAATTIQGNAAKTGAGVYNIDGAGVIANSLISGNTATDLGGGIYNAPSQAISLTNVTIAGNYAGVDGGALYNDISIAEIRNCIIYGNSSGVAARAEQQQHVEYSLVQGWTATDKGNIADSDPRFLNPLMPTEMPATGGDYQLGQGSPAINTGNQAYYDPGNTPDLRLFTTDLYDHVRINKGVVDLGAIESDYGQTITAGPGGIAYVTTQGGGDFTGSSWANATDDLQAAIDATGVAEVWVAEGTFTPQRRADDLSSITPDDPFNSFVLKKNVQVYGSFAGIEASLAERTADVISEHPSILSGEMGDEATNKDNAHHVVLSVGEVGTAALNGFIIQKGYDIDDTEIQVNNESVQGRTGAGIYNYKSSPALSNLTIKNCYAFLGGGICNDAASPKLNNVSLYLDTANFNGGGIANYNGSSPQLVNSRLQGNFANDGSGMYTENGAPLLTNVLISNNSAFRDGGGLYNLNADPVLTNVTVVYNFCGGASGGKGGSMANYGVCKFKVRNCIFYGNKGFGNGTILSEAGGGLVQYSLIQGMEEDPLNHNLNGETDPLFITPIPTNGEPSILGNYGLQEGSPAINTGSNAYFANGATPDLSTVTTDLATKERIQKEVIDLGAFESPFDHALPVTLVDYGIVQQGRTIKISWKTTMESQNKEFVVSRSQDGKSFIEIGRLPGQDNAATGQDTRYQLIDQNPLAGINYYRLTQIDQQGALTDYGIKTIMFDGMGDRDKIQLYPNPARDFINLQVADKGRLQIFDNAGRLVKRLEVVPGINKVDIRTLAKGVYFAVVSGTGNHEIGQRQQLKFIKK